jgi:uncharacterized protein (TIGR03067 family)
MPRFALLGVALLAAAVLVTSGTGTTAEPAEKKFDATKLVGEWEFSKGWMAGKETPKDKMKHPVKIDKDAITLHGDKAEDTFVISYKITDDSKEMAPIDLEIKSGPGGSKGAKAEGIIWTDGKELKLAYVVGDGKHKRPTEFKSTADNGVHYFELKKK